MYLYCVYVSVPTYVFNLYNSVYVKCALITRRLLVMQRDVTTKEGRVKGLGVFVQCNPDSPEMQ